MERTAERTRKGFLDQQRVGGIASIYLAAAYLAAIPYFLLAVDYQGAADPASKLALLVRHHASLYAFNLISYVLFGLVLAALALALHDRLRREAPGMSRVIAAWGIVWACLLVASGTVSNMGMEYVVKLQATDAPGAAAAWQVIESVSNALGGGGGEALGGPWVLLASAAGLMSRRLPRALCWVGLAAGTVGLASNVPALREIAVAFGVLQIPWLAWLGIVLLRPERG